MTHCHYYSISYERWRLWSYYDAEKDQESFGTGENAQDPCQEFKNYLDSSLEDTSDQIKWWGVSYSFI